MNRCRVGFICAIMSSSVRDHFLHDLNSPKTVKARGVIKRVSRMFIFPCSWKSRSWRGPPKSCQNIAGVKHIPIKLKGFLVAICTSVYYYRCAFRWQKRDWKNTSALKIRSHVLNKTIRTLTLELIRAFLGSMHITGGCWISKTSLGMWPLPLPGVRYGMANLSLR